MIEKAKTVDEVLSNLDELISFGFKVSIRSNYDRLSIFDWWKDYLSVSNLKDMRKFLLEAKKLGFTGYCCFKVGVTGCANGMWAHKDETTDGYSPKNSPCIYKSFTPAYNYWEIDVKGDNNWLPAGDKYDSLKTKKEFEEFVKSLEVK